MDKKINPTDVGERINDTKKEIAQLSEELERLIKSNAGLSNIESGQSHSENVNTNHSIQIKNEDNSKNVSNIHPTNKKLNDTGKKSVLPGPKIPAKPELVCNKKITTHSKEATREFMRQQREKREEEKKRTDSKNKIDQELKKQKLLELQQRSLALVQRNIQLKRERSKSRDRKGQVRIDKSNVGRSSGGNPLPKNSSNESIPHTKKSIEIRKPAKIQVKQILIPKNKYESKNECRGPRINNSHKVKTLEKRFSPCETRRNCSEKPSQNEKVAKLDPDLAARKIQTFYKEYRHRKQLDAEKILSQQHLKENPITETKETQTSSQKQIEFPAWLQPPTIDPYPCNFINTIKKKLQLVVNSPVRSKDIGVQSSIIEKKSEMKESYESIRKPIKANIKSDKTVDSHSQKATNLDADALQHFALNNFREKISQNIKDQTDSESDTSKNIPEISTESGLLSDEKIKVFTERNENVLHINTDKIKNLTLRKPMEANISKKSYTFNFSEEYDSKHQDRSPEKVFVEESSSNKNSRSPRDSILSFNISNDTSLTFSSSTSQKDKHITEIVANEEIKTEQSNTFGDSSRKKLSFPLKKTIKTSKTDENYESNTYSNFPQPTSHMYVRTPPDHISSVSQISEEKKNSSHISSRSSIDNSRKGIITKREELLGNIEANLKSPSIRELNNYSNKFSNDNDSDSSEVLTSLTSSKFSHPNTLAVPVKSSSKSFPDEKIQSLFNSLASNQSKKSNSLQEVITDMSEIDISKNSFQMPRKVLGEKNKESQKNNTCQETTETLKSSSKNLNLSDNSTKPEKSNEKKLTSQVVKDFKSSVVQSKSDTNEIHLKFEAEVHLLNDFNDSLKQFMAVEKAFESLKHKNESSFRNSSKNSSALILSSDSKISSHLNKHIGSTINTSRGSDLDDSHLMEDSLLNSHIKSSNNLELSSMQKSCIDNDSFSFSDNIPNNLAGLSIKMFEQFIKDEDIRIENLKTIIKIREQALLDRTKGELAWLEIQRKHLKETGKLHEASLVKKKQRGILLKHQQERREMQRLKQLQKMQSNERKTILKEQKNLIKAKLTSEKLISDFKIQTPRKQRPTGPLRVFKASESHSESSLPRIASDGEEIFSITSRSRSIKLSENDSSREIVFKQEEMDFKKFGAVEDIDKMKKALLLRQDSLMKRRKAVEDLLKRHQKLLEEEKKIKELEMAANAIIMQLPSKSASNRIPKMKSHLKGLNQKMLSSSGESKYSDDTSALEPLHKSSVDEQKKNDNEMYGKNNKSQSEYSFNTFYENAKSSIDKIKSEKDDIQSISSILQKGSSVQYSEDFESDEQLLETDSKDNISSISGLIEDFTQIEHGISMFSKQFDEMALDKSVNESNLHSSHDTKKNEELGSSKSIILTDRMQTEYDIINSLKDNDISTFLNSKDSAKISGEISTRSKQRENQIPNTESVKSSLEEFLPSTSQNEELDSENISSEIESIKEVTVSEQKHKSIEENLISDSISVAEKLEKQTGVEIETKSIFEENPKQVMNVSESKDNYVDKTHTEPTQIGEQVSTIEEISEKDSNLLEQKITSEENQIFVNSSIQTNTECSKSKTAEKEWDLTVSETLPKRGVKNHSSEENISELISIPKTTEHSNSNTEKNLLTEKNSVIDNELIEELTNKKIVEEDVPEKFITSDVILSESRVDKENISSQFELSNQIEDIPTDQDYVQNSGIISESAVESKSPINVIVIKTNEFSIDEISEQNKKEKKSVEDLSSKKIVGINSIQKHIEDENVKSMSTKDLVNIHSEKEETYKDIPSIETTSEIYISEIKTDDSTTEDISEINNVLELNLENTELNELGYKDESLSNQEGKNKAVEKSFDTGNSEDVLNRAKPLSVLDEISVQKIDEDSFTNNKSLSGQIESTKDSVSLMDKEKVEIYSTREEIISTVFEEGSSVEEYREDETDVLTEAKEGSSSNSYSDDFEDEKEVSVMQEITDKSASNSTGKTEKINKVSETDDVLMVKIDLSLDPSKKQAEIIIMNEDSHIISNTDSDPKRDEVRPDEDKLKSPIQQRVSQILANTVGSQKSPRDKNTRYQDYYVTTYEDITPVNSPESASPAKSNQVASINTFNNEAEELLKKQLAIELEIKHLEQQQKEQLPFVYMREIPNKPPPPYTPPSAQSNAVTILPNKADELKEICRYSAKVLYNAYLSNNLHAVTFSETDFKTINKTKSSKECCLFVFDLCREIAENHYKRFQTKKVPAWLKLPDESRLILGKPFSYHQLESHIHNKVKELLGFEKKNIRENSIIRWSKKKKDHVDEILLLESQAEEQEWLNYDNDELMVKNEVTDAILDILLSETVGIYKNIFS